MELKLEQLPYQDAAIQTVVKVFDGTEKNIFDSACFEGIRSNVCALSAQQIKENIANIAAGNGLGTSKE